MERVRLDEIGEYGGSLVNGSLLMLSLAALRARLALQPCWIAHGNERVQDSPLSGR